MAEPPEILVMGVTGVLVRFATRLSEPANRAALAFRAAAEAEGWPGVAETSASLASAFLRVDPGAADPRDVAERARALAASRDWGTAPLPPGRRLWTIPCAWGGAEGPGLARAAPGAEAEAVAALSEARLRVLTLGFAPGQPYLGELPPDWDLPRAETLAEVPWGAVVLAVRQLTLFTSAGPTGWAPVGLTAFRTFRPGNARPAAFAPGDEVRFAAADPDRIAELRAAEGPGADPDGGATAEALR